MGISTIGIPLQRQSGDTVEGAAFLWSGLCSRKHRYGPYLLSANGLSEGRGLEQPERELLIFSSVLESSLNTAFWPGGALMSVISKLRKEDCQEFKISLSYRVRSFLNKYFNM